jgi:hypothetical protein
MQGVMRLQTFIELGAIHTAPPQLRHGVRGDPLTSARNRESIGLPEDRSWHEMLRLSSIS